MLILMGIYVRVAGVKTEKMRFLKCMFEKCVFLWHKEVKTNDRT